MAREQLFKDIGPYQEVRSAIGEGFRVTKHGLVYYGQPFGQGLEGPHSGLGVTDVVPASRDGDHRTSGGQMGDDRCLELAAFLHDERDELEALVVVKRIGVSLVPRGFSVEVESIDKGIPEHVIPRRGCADP